MKQESSQNIVVQLNILTGTIIQIQSFFNEDGTLNAKKIDTNVESMKKKLGGMFALKHTVMRFQQFLSIWNRNLSNLYSVQQTVAHMKADIKPKLLLRRLRSIIWHQEVVKVAKFLQNKMQQMFFG